MKRIQQTLLVVAGLLTVFIPTAQAQLPQELVLSDSLTSDNFLSSANDDVDLRQSGPLAPLNFAENNALGFQIEIGSEGLILYPEANYASISPNVSLNSGGSFTIEFDVNPGLDDSNNESGDWCAVVFGSSSQNNFVNASAGGMGVLFRNNGNIQVFDGGAAIYGGNGGFEGGLETDDYFSVRIEVQTANFTGSPATVSMYINDEPAIIAGESDTSYTKEGGFRGNFVTLGGYAGAGNNWQHGFRNLTLSQEPCIELGPGLTNTHVGQEETMTIALPQSLIDAGESQLTITTTDPLVVAPEGADDTGTLVLDINGSSSLEQTITLVTTGAGRAQISATSSINACVSGIVQVNVAAGVGFPETLLTDNFNISENTWDLNEGLNARQSGTLGTVEYIEGENTAAGGLADDLTQVNNELYPNQLLIIGQGNGVSPNHNFIEGTDFSVEVTVHPGPNWEFADSTDWSSVIIGATTPNRFVNAHDGFGVLFRNNGFIEVWDGSSNVFSSPTDNPLPAAPYRVRLEASTFSFDGDPVEIRLFVNDEPYPLSNNGMSYIKQSGFFGNYITLAGFGDALDHTFDDLEINAVACINFVESSLSLRDGDEASIQVKVPEKLVETESATVRVISNNPFVAAPEGSVDGVLELTFSPGASLIQSIPLEIMSKGTASFTLEGPEGVCIGPDLEISISSAIVANPSFEADNVPAWPGYGPVSEWSGFSGINDGTGPFHDNSVVPDRSKIAFAQGSRTASQTVRGLEAGESYWVQMFYNVRNCCGDRTVNFTVSVDGTPLETVSNVNAAAQNPYFFRSLEFTANSDEALLEITTDIQGDGTLLVDAVTIVPAGEDLVTIANPSFEASGVPPFPGYINPDRIAGWNGTGSYGVNFTGAGPFADNGLNSDQDLVAFIQGASSLSQTINGLLAGQSYGLTLHANARSGNSPILRISAGDNVIFEEAIEPVGAGSPYRMIETTFEAPSSSVVLTIEQIAEGDNTILVDDVSISGESVNIPPVTLSVESLELPAGATNGSFTIGVPQLLIENDDAVIRIISQNPDVAVPAGAENGILELTFDQGGDLERLVEIDSLARGSTTFLLEGPPGITFTPSAINIQVITSLVRNPSFEANFNPTFPGYSPIDSWSKSEGAGGNQGVNEAAGPFHDNGIIPDRGRIGFIQVSNALFQDIHGLTPDQPYLLEFYYNTRNCCGGVIDLTVNFDEQEVDTILALQPVGADQPYNYASYIVTPTSEVVRLEFVTTAEGDATALLDAVTLTPLAEDDIAIANASFEASGRVAAFPGYIQPAPIAGWTATGNYGTNASGEGPFADNGSNPDQDLVLFLQGEASISQEIVGLSSGESYIIEVAANARGGNSPTLQISVNDSAVFTSSVSPVGGTEPYRTVITGFTAGSDSVIIKLAQTAAGDNTVLLDHVRIYPGVPPKGAPELGIAMNGANITLSWPADSDGFGLVTAPSVNGPWTPVTQPVITQDGSLTVTLTPSATTAFFRLVAE